MAKCAGMPLSGRGLLTAACHRTLAAQSSIMYKVLDECQKLFLFTVIATFIIKNKKKMTGKQSVGGEACVPGDVRYELASQICVFMNRDRLLRHRDKRSLWIIIHYNVLYLFIYSFFWKMVIHTSTGTKKREMLFITEILIKKNKLAGFSISEGWQCSQPLTQFKYELPHLS